MKAKLILSDRCLRNTLLLPFCAALLLLLLPVAGLAQDTGYIAGTVTDKSGAAVAGAKIVLNSVTGGITRDSETNADGAYTIAGLPGGSYNLTVTATGFQKFLVQKIVLDVAQKSRIDVTLIIGTITQEMVVNGEDVAQVDTQSAEISTTITGKQVDQLELNGRNFSQLITLAPGVANQTGEDEGAVGVAGNVSFSVNGGRNEYNNWELDGGDNMDNGSNQTLNVYPNLEAIAEFKVLTSNYGAQYGRNGSGTVEVETKSGTNQFHGSAFEYLRNDFFNANSWQNNAQGIARPEYKKHDFGYTIGGPLYIPGLYHPAKQKTFFFWSQEWRKEIVPGGNINQAVPSDAERNGNFNDVCPAAAATFSTTAFPDCPFSSVTPDGLTGTAFANNTVPIDPTGAALTALIPKANNFTGIDGMYTTGQAAGSPIPVYVSDPSLPTTWREQLIRVDHNLTDSERLTFRYIHDSWKTVNENALWGNGSSFDNLRTNFVGPGTSFVARLTSNFTPTLLNEFVASYTADHINLSLTGPSTAIPSGFTLTPLFANNFENKLPAFSVGNTSDGLVYGGGFSVDTGYFPWKNANPTYTYRDNVTKTVGEHTLIFGAYFAAAQKNQDSSVYLQGILGFGVNTSFESAVPNMGSTGNPFADLLTGQVGSYTQTSKQPYFYDRYKILEPYFEDDWHVSKKLTLNLGLRWSIFGRYQEKFDQEFNFSEGAYVAANAPVYFAANDPNGNQALLIPGSGNFLNGIIQCGAKGVTTGCQKNKWINPGPRIGFAFDPKGDGKTAIRGGYGIFFEHMNGNEANAEALQAGTSPTVLIGSVSNISGYANVGGSLGAPTAISPSNTVSIPDKTLWPYVQQWNLGIQHELPGHTLLGVSYVGSKGTQLSYRSDANQLPFLPAADNPYPAGTPITLNDCNSIVPGPTGLPVSATVAGGIPVTGQAVVNLAVACGQNIAAYYRPFQGYGTITRIANGADSSYHSLQVSAQRTIGDLTFSLAYTYSHSIDDSSDWDDNNFVDSFNKAINRASSNFDQRHIANISYVYAFPFFKHSEGLTRTLLGGWQASGITTIQSGLPFDVVNGSTYADNAGVGKGVGTSSWLDVVGNPNIVPAIEQQYFAASGEYGVLRYNPAAFQLPTGLTYGTSGRNDLRLPGRTNFDFGMRKRFAFKERYAFEFRWENFNVFNHTQLDAVGGSSNAFGTGAQSADSCNTAINAGDQSCFGGGFLVLNQSHNPRIMQFALRFEF